MSLLRRSRYAPLIAALLCFATTLAMSEPTNAADPYLWLEDVQGERALAWVRERNAQSQKELTARAEYAPTRSQLLEVLNARDRIPYFVRRGDWLYNFWQDEANKRGLWRRTTLTEYQKPQPAWETMIDLDALAKAEGENWVWGGSNCLGPDYRHCLVMLSRGGADAKVVREFDATSKRFVGDGFVLPEAKTDVEWIDKDTLYVATDFGPGSMTDSGYPRIVKRWKRGTPLADALTVFEGQKQDVAAGVSIDRTPGFERTLFVRSMDFYHQQTFLLQGEKLTLLDVPSDSSLSFMRDTLLLHLRSDLKVGEQTFLAGSLLHADAAGYLRGERKLRPLFTPTATRSLAGYTTTRDHVIVNVLDNVASKLEQWLKRGGEFSFSEIKAPFPGTLGVSSLHDELIKDDALANRYLLTYTDFLTPDSLFLATAGSDTRELLKSRKPLFDARGMRVEQRFATSKDGTRVPYFVVWPRGASADGSNPMQLTSSPSNDLDPSWSASGDKIAYTVEAADKSTREIWVMNGDGSGKTRLTAAPNYSSDPNWSPDGQWIVFDSDRGEKGNFDLYKMHPDGSGLVRLTDSPALDALPAFSPDGTRIVFVSDRAAKDSRKLYVMSATGGGADRVIKVSGQTYQMVPDWQPLVEKDPCTIRGTIHADTLVGTPGPDVICGLDGNDAIRGFGGDDRLLGGRGNDLLYGGPGRDALSGQAGNDALYAKDGARDVADGGQGEDTALVDPRLDRLVGIERHNRR